MKVSNLKNNFIKKTSTNFIKKCETRNISNKKNFSTSKKKYFSISSKEDLIKNKFKNIFVNNDLKLLKNNTKRDYKTLGNHFITIPKYFSQNTSKFKNTLNFNNNNNNNNTNNKNIQSDNCIKYKKNKKIDNIIRRNKLKQTIIIDNEGNNNLNMNKKYFTQNTSQKVCLINAKKHNTNKYHIKPITKITKYRKDINDINLQTDIVKNLLNIFKNDNLDNNNNKPSIISESNSLFINSKIAYEQKKLNNNNNNYLNIEVDNKILNSEKEDKLKENKRIKEYNKIIDILKFNIDDIKNMVNTDNNHNNSNNNDICDYNSFYKNIPENKCKNINLIDNKENFNNNYNDLRSFLESSIQDDFYQSLLYKKSAIEKNQNDDSFNFCQSISEFDSIKYENNKYEFEKIIHLPMKNEIKINHINFLKEPQNQNEKTNINNKKYDKNYEKNNNMYYINIGENNLNENKNNICIIF